MLTLKDHIKEETDFLYLNETYDTLSEALITFGGQAHPKFGNVVIMAGGAGSGKGFVKDNLVGMSGKVFDVDELKSLAMRSKKINSLVKKEFDVDLMNMNLRNPKNVSKLHAIIGDELNIPDKRKKAFYSSVLSAHPERKPNIIFDVTLKDLGKLEKLSYAVQELGYDKKKIHIVWVVNDIRVAAKQNVKRDRKVPTEILLNTHRGASQTMGDIIKMGGRISKYMDGDLVIAFNKVGVDGEVEKSSKGGMYIKKGEYFYVKNSGKATIPYSDIEASIKAKIKDYVPKSIDWN